MTAASLRFRVPDFRRSKEAGRKIVMLTCYDALFAKLLDTAVDVLLVGDSLHQVLGGHETTLGATLDQMIYHAAAVRRGASHALVLVDLPFLSYQVSVEEAIRHAGRVLRETDAQAVKLEGGRAMAPTVHALVERGIPVVGHLGLTPQSLNLIGGYKVQGRTLPAAEAMLADAKALEEAGASAVVLELVPDDVAARISEALSIPTIGIGAGVGCDGQVLVLHDLLGLTEAFRPRFLKRYAELATTVRSAVGTYAEEVRRGVFPGPEHGFRE
jgi:3-methyl-2-oxobutanoate hydroxymethyltransferase